MKYLFFIAITLLLTACGSPAATTETKATNGTQKEETSHESEVHNGDGGFLWKVQEGDTTVYLQGTIHAAYEDMYPLNPYLEAAYDEADVLLPEIDWPHADPGLSEDELMDLITLKDGLTLSELLGEETFEDLVKILEPQGKTGEMINHFKPWRITDLLLNQLAPKDSKATFKGGVDYHYLERAAEDGKEIKELEGHIVSLLALDSMSMELQVERLKDTIAAFYQSDTDVPEVTFDDSVDAWLAGDEETFIKNWDMFTYGEEFDDVYLFRRNSDNADIIDSLLQEDTDKTYLALIGAGHFLIEPGIQHYLEEKGYTVERIY